MKACLLPVLAGADAADLVQKIHVPGTTSKLAVGHALARPMSCHFHDLADGLIFDAPTIFRADTPLRVVVSCLEGAPSFEEDFQRALRGTVAQSLMRFTNLRSRRVQNSEVDSER